MAVQYPRAQFPSASRYILCCKCCTAQCNSNFERVMDLQKTGLVVYIHKRCAMKYRPPNDKYDAVILLNTTDKHFKSPAFMTEVGQQKTSCFQCDNIIRRVRNSLAIIKSIAGNEAVSVCDYCKQSNVSYCRRCEYIVRKFMSHSANAKDAVEQYLKTWLRKVMVYLQSNIEECISKHNLYLRDKCIEELQILLNECIRPGHYFKEWTRKVMFSLQSMLEGIFYSHYHTYRQDSVFGLQKLINELKLSTNLSALLRQPNMELFPGIEELNSLDNLQVIELLEKLLSRVPENITPYSTSIYTTSASTSSLLKKKKIDNLPLAEKKLSKKYEYENSIDNLFKNKNMTSMRKYGSAKSTTKHLSEISNVRYSYNDVEIINSKNIGKVEKFFKHKTKCSEDQTHERKVIKHKTKGFEDQIHEIKVIKHKTKGFEDQTHERKGIKHKTKGFENQTHERKGIKHKTKGFEDQTHEMSDGDKEDLKYKSKPKDRKKDEVNQRYKSKNRVNIEDNEDFKFKIRGINRKIKTKPKAQNFVALMNNLEKNIIEMKKNALPEIKVPTLLDLPIKREKRIFDSPCSSVIQCVHEQNSQKNMIIGQYIEPLNLHDKEDDNTNIPVLYHVHRNISSHSLSQTLPKETILRNSLPPVSPKHKSQSDLNDKGVIKYQLSNPEYVTKGWTQLPSLRVMRRINIYKMKPVDNVKTWFERNKKRNFLYKESKEKFADVNDDGYGKLYYKNGRLALDYYKATELNVAYRYVIYSDGEPVDGTRRPVTVLAVFDGIGCGVVYDIHGRERLKYNQNEGMLIDKTVDTPCKWKWHTLNDPPKFESVFVDLQQRCCY